MKDTPSILNQFLRARLRKSLDRAYELVDILEDEENLKQLPELAVMLPPRGVSFDDIEREALLIALRRSDWNQKRTAALLHTTARVINYKIRKHRITSKQWVTNRPGDKE